MTDDEVMHKYLANVAGYWPDAKAKRVAELVWALDEAASVVPLVTSLGEEG
jgi:hypothetical protein